MLPRFSIPILRVPLVFYCEPVIEDWLKSKLKVNVVHHLVGQQHTRTLFHTDLYLGLVGYIINEQHRRIYHVSEQCWVLLVFRWLVMFV